MEILSSMLGRLVGLCVIISIGELMLPSGGLKKSVRLLTGLMVAEMVLKLALSLPGALAG